MKHGLILICTFLMTVPTLAADKSTYSEAAYVRNTSSIFGALGFQRGGMVFGGDYEYHIEHTFGVGGYFRLADKDEDKNAIGSTLLGGFVRPHFHRRNWEFHLTAGFGIIDIDGVNNQDSEAGMGPMLGLGLMYQFTRQVALGVENAKYYNWFGDDYKGVVIDHLTINLRYSM